MLNSLLGLVARLTIGKQLVGIVAKIHNSLDGHRSEISLGVLALVHALKLAGIIPAEAAEAIEKSLAAIIPVVLADKAAKFIAVVDKVVPPVVPVAPVAPVATVDSPEQPN